MKQNIEGHSYLFIIVRIATMYGFEENNDNIDFIDSLHTFTITVLGAAIVECHGIKP